MDFLIIKKNGFWMTNIFKNLFRTWHSLNVILLVNGTGLQSKFCKTYFSKHSSKCIWLWTFSSLIFTGADYHIHKFQSKIRVLQQLAHFKRTKWFMTPKVYFLFMLVCTLVKHLCTHTSDCPQSLSFIGPSCPGGVSALPLACQVWQQSDIAEPG